MSFVITGLQVVNTVQQGVAARRQADIQARQLEYQATQEREAAVEEARKVRRSGDAARGEAAAAIAASGVKVGEGSALEIDRRIGEDAESDALAALLTGGRRARSLELEAGLGRVAGKQQQAAAFASAASTALSGGYSMSGWKTRPPSKGDGLSQGERRQRGVY